MSEIHIEYDLPVVFTKDANYWPGDDPLARPGAIIVLPEDAVLVFPRETINVQAPAPKEQRESK